MHAAVLPRAAQHGGAMPRVDPPTPPPLCALRQMSSARSTALPAQPGAAAQLQKHGPQCPLAPRPSRLPRRSQVAGRTVLRIEAVAAPEQAAAGTEFRAWTSPSVKHVAKRTDLKK